MPSPDPATDPFAVDFGNIDFGDLAARPDTIAGLNKQVDAALAAFKADRSKEDRRFLDVTDSEYWFCLCFQNRDQKEEFLRRMGWLDLGDKYLDGTECAARQKIPLDPARAPGARKPGKRWLQHTDTPAV